MSGSDHTETLERPAITQFDDYRTYLAAMYQFRRSEDGTYTYQEFSRRAGYASPNYLRLVIDGKRNLTARAVPRFAKALALTHDETGTLMAMALGRVDLLGAQGLFPKDAAMEGEAPERRPVAAHDIELLSDWYCPVIREALALARCDGTAQWLVDHIWPPLSVAQVRAALVQLTAAGLVEELSGGRYSAADGDWLVDVPGASPAWRFALRVLDVTLTAIESLPTHTRRAITVAGALSAPAFAELDKRVDRLHSDVTAILERTQNAATARVYLLSVSILAATRSPDIDRRDKPNVAVELVPVGAPQVASESRVAEPAAPQASPVSAERPGIFDFRDYRRFLSAMFDYQQFRDPGFTYRECSRRAGYSSPNFLRLIIDGTRNLTARAVPRFGKALALTDEERTVLLAMSLAEHTTTIEERARYQQRIEELHRLAHKRAHTSEELTMYVDWYYAAIREATSLAGFDGTASWLAARLYPRISEAKVEAALAHLCRVGVVVKTATSYQPSESALWMNEPVASARRYHHRVTGLIGNAVYNLPRSERRVLSLAVRTTPEGYAEINTAITDQLWQGMAGTSGAADAVDGEVYFMSAAIVPVTR